MQMVSLAPAARRNTSETLRAPSGRKFWIATTPARRPARARQPERGFADDAPDRSNPATTAGALWSSWYLRPGALCQVLYAGFRPDLVRCRGRAGRKSPRRGLHLLRLRSWRSGVVPL